jgi:hypothetical protein
VAEILLIRTLNGYAPADDEAQEVAKKHKIGSLIRGDLKEMRNGPFFRKWWALVKLGFEYFEDSCPQQEHKGVAVLANFERFRKDVTIMAGFYTPVWNIKGEMRVDAESLKWSKMTEERFTKLYDKTIAVLLKMVFNGERCKKWSEAELRTVIEQVENFA